MHRPAKLAAASSDHSKFGPKTIERLLIDILQEGWGDKPKFTKSTHAHIIENFHTLALVPTSTSTTTQEPMQRVPAATHTSTRCHALVSGFMLGDFEEERNEAA